MKKIGYVSDIDILRGISILLVFIILKLVIQKHICFQGLLGVDIFCYFRISNYINFTFKF